MALTETEMFTNAGVVGDYVSQGIAITSQPRDLGTEARATWETERRWNENLLHPQVTRTAPEWAYVQADNGGALPLKVANLLAYEALNVAGY